MYFFHSTVWSEGADEISINQHEISDSISSCHSNHRFISMHSIGYVIIYIITTCSGTLYGECSPERDF